MIETPRQERPYFKEEHLMYRNALRKFLENEAIPNYDKWEDEQWIPRIFWKKLGSNGFLCPSVSEEYGGAGGDFAMALILNEELAKVGSSLSGPATHSNIVVPYIESFGTKEQKMKYLPGCVTGDIITAIAMTEPGAGSDLANIRTAAIRDGDHYIVNGQKTFITNGIHADLIVLAVKTDPQASPPHKGVSLLLVEADTPGYMRGKKLKKLGMLAQDTAELIFEDMRVPASHLIGEEGHGFTYLMAKLQQERLLAAISSVTASEDMFETTLQYVKERHAFGKPIGKFQNTQFAMAEMATQITMARAFVNQLVVRHQCGEEIVTEVSMAKWWITDMARNISAKCVQLHGGYGFMEEYKIARRYRDLAVFPIFAGSNEIMKSIIAKRLGL